MALFEHHVFVCQNSRPEGAPRPSCTKDGKSDLLPALQMFTKAAGLGGTVRINKAGCLDQCEHGPTVVVYPEAVWYGNVQAADAEKIVNEHLLGGRPVERLRLADECVNTKTCPTSGVRSGEIRGRADESCVLVCGTLTAASASLQLQLNVLS